MKVFKLPEFAPNARGKPMIGIFPLTKGENITAVLPLPNDKTSWENLNIMFLNYIQPLLYVNTLNSMFYWSIF